MNIIIISSSPRKGGNTDLLCDQYMRGAQEAGHTVEKIRIASKKINYCLGCYACKKENICCQKDDAAEVIAKMMAADVIVLATPVYFYTMCAQLKTLIDRTVCIFPKLTNKKYFYLMAMGEAEVTHLEGTLEALRGFPACYEGSEELGYIIASGAYQKGAILNLPAYQEAYEAGKNLK